MLQCCRDEKKMKIWLPFSSLCTVFLRRVIEAWINSEKTYQFCNPQFNSTSKWW